MGIKHLNKYLIEKCKSIKKTHLKNFKDKNIVIDTSIYMYKFLSENALIENMTKMIVMFRKYNINPIFVFDGKPPPEKKELLKERKNFKSKAQEKYDELYQSSINGENVSMEELNMLKSQFLKLSENDIQSVKDLFDSMNITYLISSTEADPLCVYLVNSNKVFACLTEDMDMFVYGCNRIMRSIDLENHNIIFYCIKNILNELNISFLYFKQILVLSGTDYNIGSSTNLYTTLNLYNKYKKIPPKYKDCSFYKWLEHYNPCYIQDRNKLEHCFNMFNLNYYDEELKPFMNVCF
jgi:flap endonuclease-1